MELLVRCDERLRRLRRIHLGQTSLERLEVLLAQPARRQPGRYRLEDAPHLVELEQGPAGEEVADEAHAREQKLGLEARHIRSVADARLEDADQGERAYGFPQRVARQPELLRQLLLGRQLGVRCELPRHDHVLDLRELADLAVKGDVRQFKLVGDAGAFDDLVPAVEPALAVGGIVVAQPHIDGGERRLIHALDRAVDELEHGIG